MKKVVLSIIVFICCVPLNVFAQRGCCSHHGGVAGCSSSGRQICADGTLSPSCTCTPPAVYGCTDPKANNYNSNANKEDGSCQYTIYGCTNPEAINYNQGTNTPDGTCIFEKEIKEKVSIPYETTYTTKKEEETSGTNGTREVTYKVQYNENNEEITRTKLTEEIIVQPINEVIYQAEDNKEETKTVSSEINSEMDSSEESNAFAIVYIGIVILVFILAHYKKEKKSIINKILTTNHKYLLIVIYLILIIPAFIDFVIFLIPTKKKLH